MKVGTVFESSHVALHIWLQAVALLSSSQEGHFELNQLHRTLGVTLKTAWFMSHRIREAMRDGTLAPMGGNGGIVEMDETYHGKVATPRDVTTSGRPYTKSGKTGPSNKRAIVSLVERGGKVRSFHVENADKATVNKIVNENIAREARVHTDESRLYGRASTPLRTKPCAIHLASTFAATFTPTPSKAISRSSNAACGAPISIAGKASAPLPCRVRFPP